MPIVESRSVPLLTTPRPNPAREDEKDEEGVVRPLREKKAPVWG